MAQLKQDLATKDGTIKEMQEDIETRQLALDDLATENNSLSDKNTEMKDKNDKYVDELSILAKTVEELVGKSWMRQLDLSVERLSYFCAPLDTNHRQ